MPVADARVCLFPADGSAIDALLHMLADVLIGASNDAMPVDALDDISHHLVALYRSILLHAYSGETTGHIHVTMLRHHAGSLVVIIRDTSHALPHELADLLLMRAGDCASGRYIITPHGNIWQLAYTPAPVLALLAA